MHYLMYLNTFNVLERDGKEDKQLSAAELQLHASSTSCVKKLN